MIFSLFITLVCLVLTGLFTVAETAYSRLSHAHAEDLVEDGRHRARQVYTLVEKRRVSVTLSRMLKIFFEIATVVFGFKVISGFNAPVWLTTLLCLLCSAVFLSLVDVIIGYRIGRYHTDSAALALAGPLSVLVKLAIPFTGIYHRLLPPPALTEQEARVEMADDLREMVDEIGTDEDLRIEEEDREIMRSVFDMNTTLVREVVVPRTDMVTLDMDDTLADALDLFIRSGLSRIPVVGETRDDVRGVLYFKDTVGRTYSRPEYLDRPAYEFMREALFVPEMVRTDDLLRQMQEPDSPQIAMVVDEWGGTVGLVTIEDLLEELVGDLADEHDRDEPEPEDLGDGSWRIPAATALDELGELFELDIDDDDVDTAGGLLAKARGKVPLVGDVVEVQGLRLTVERMALRRVRVSSIIAERAPDRQEEDGDVEH